MRKIALALTLLAAPALAQTTVRSTPLDSFKFLPHDEINRRLETPEAGHPYSAWVINDHENYFIEFMKRLDHGNLVEQHTHSIDQITILGGEGVLTYGGTIPGAVPNAMGEYRGETQVGGKTQALHPGDFVLIPAGMPHKFDAAPGKTLYYVVSKARQ